MKSFFFFFVDQNPFGILLFLLVIVGAVCFARCAVAQHAAYLWHAANVYLNYIKQ